MCFLKGAILSYTDRTGQKESREYFIRHWPAVRMMFSLVWHWKYFELIIYSWELSSDGLMLKVSRLICEIKRDNGSVYSNEMKIISQLCLICMLAGLC